MKCIISKYPKLSKKFLLIIIAGLMVAHTCEAHFDNQPATHTTIVASPSHGKPPGPRVRDVICTLPVAGTWSDSCQSATVTPSKNGLKSCHLDAYCWKPYPQTMPETSVDYNPGDYVINCNGQLTVGSQCP